VFLCLDRCLLIKLLRDVTVLRCDIQLLGQIANRAATKVLIPNAQHAELKAALQNAGAPLLQGHLQHIRFGSDCTWTVMENNNTKRGHNWISLHAAS